MKILVISGTNKESSIGKMYSRALKKLEYDVYEFFDIDEMEKHSIIFELPFFKNINYWRMQEKHYCKNLQAIVVNLFQRLMIEAETKSNKNLIKLCREINPDMLIVFKGKSIRKDTLLAIKESTGCILLQYNDDDYNNLFSTSKNMLDSLPVYDIVFSWAYDLFEPLYKLGAKRVEYLPFGFDESLHIIQNISSSDKLQFEHDVVFVGTWDKEREKWLSTLADLELGIWGPRWNRVSSRSPLRKCIKSGEVNTKIMGKIYRASKICLNIVRPQNAKSHNMKSFEIPALGGFMLANRTPEHLNIFKEGKEIACFDSIDELRSQVLRYISEDSKRKEMAKAAQKKVRNYHSYTNRAITIIDLLRKEKLIN